MQLSLSIYKKKISLWIYCPLKATSKCTHVIIRCCEIISPSDNDRFAIGLTSICITPFEIFLMQFWWRLHGGYMEVWCRFHGDFEGPCIYTCWLSHAVWPVAGLVEVPWRFDGGFMEVLKVPVSTLADAGLMEVFLEDWSWFHGDFKGPCIFISWFSYVI